MNSDNHMLLLFAVLAVFALWIMYEAAQTRLSFYVLHARLRQLEPQVVEVAT